ncbi:MAG: hypothetical protein U0414_22305 [Polyangiaceae bacterium]
MAEERRRIAHDLDVDGSARSSSSNASIASMVRSRGTRLTTSITSLAPSRRGIPGGFSLGDTEGVDRWKRW